MHINSSPEFLRLDPELGAPLRPTAIQAYVPFREDPTYAKDRAAHFTNPTWESPSALTL